jgi:hypothetical protein
MTKLWAYYDLSLRQGVSLPGLISFTLFFNHSNALAWLLIIVRRPVGV